MTNYLIIDNNTSVIKTIQDVLDGIDNFNSVGTSINKSEIMNCILDKNAELVFLNIDSTDESFLNTIFEIQQLKIHLPKFIAISRAKKNAYKAIKAGFCDFLDLPFDKNEIHNAIIKLMNLNSFTNRNSICIKSYKDFQYVDLDSIVYLKADNNTTDFFLKNRSEVSAYKTLKTFEQSMPANFIRIHRSFMVNINYISRIQYGRNTCTVKFLNQEIPFSKTYLENIEKLVHFLNGKSVH